jgi:hypothetical protein
LEQGFITQSVTNYLNVAGAVCLTIWGILLWYQRGNSRTSWALWLFLTFGLVALAVIHIRMDQSLDPNSRSVTGSGFHSFHRAYIAISTLQWIASLMLLSVTLHLWRQADRRDLS